MDWIYVSDVVNGFLALAQAPDVDGATLDLGSGSLVSIREIVQQLAMSIGNGVKPEFGALPDRPLEPTRLARTAETFARIGWRPKCHCRKARAHRGLVPGATGAFTGCLQSRPSLTDGTDATE